MTEKALLFVNRNGSSLEKDLHTFVYITRDDDGKWIVCAQNEAIGSHWEAPVRKKDVRRFALGLLNALEDD